MARKSKKLTEISEIIDGHTIEEFEEINVTVLKVLFHNKTITKQYLHNLT